MSILSTTILILHLLTVSTIAANEIKPIIRTPSCPIIHDGRIPNSLKNLTTFDRPTSPFNPDFVKGKNLKFSEIITFAPSNISRSTFDLKGGRPIQLTIDQKSIFTPSPSSKPQTGFRRVGLLLAGNNGTDASVRGVKTFHWSMMSNQSRKLNTSHEYMVAWHERNDYSGNQFSLHVGILIGRGNLTEPANWKFMDGKGRVVAEGWRGYGWANFAVVVDYVKDTIQLFYSTEDAPLDPLTEVIKNDNSGGGQFQIGLLKKPTGNTTDVVHEGYQSDRFEESLIFGGIFVEDSEGGCVTL